MRRASLRYIDRGIAVFPVSATDKRPLVKDWPNVATLDPAQARAWWRKWPEANLGALCSWFFAVDVDPRNGGDHELATLLEQHGPFPTTWEQRSARGGSHYLFRHHQALESVPLGRFTDGIDIKGNAKHYILAAPSHTKHGPYRWIRGPRDCEIADAPEWLVRLIVEAKRVPEPEQTSVPHTIGGEHAVDRISRARAYARTLHPAIEGSNGSRATFVAAAKVARGFALSESEAFAVLASEWNPHCSPPWKEHDLRRQVARALTISTYPFGGLLEGRS